MSTQVAGSESTPAERSAAFPEPIGYGRIEIASLEKLKELEFESSSRR